MRRATLDTNIYISGLNYPGKPYRVLELAREGRIIAAISDPILKEVDRILQGKLAWPTTRARQAIREIQDFARHVTPIGRFDVIKEDPDDNRILGCAVASESAYIVTGDKDLLRLALFGPIEILTASEFLDL